MRRDLKAAAQVTTIMRCEGNARCHSPRCIRMRSHSLVGAVVCCVRWVVLVQAERLKVALHEHVFAGPDLEVDQVGHWLVTHLGEVHRNARTVGGQALWTRI